MNLTGISNSPFHSQISENSNPYSLFTQTQPQSTSYYHSPGQIQPLQNNQYALYSFREEQKLIYPIYPVYEIVYELQADSIKSPLAASRILNEWRMVLWSILTFSLFFWFNH